MLRILFTVLCLYSTQAVPYALNIDQIRETNIRLVSQMIAIVRPKLHSEKKNKIARSLSTIANEHKINPKIVIAIIDTESGFRQSSISPTGDISMVQINPRVWSKEFERIGLEKLDIKKLKKNEAYALQKMMQILSELKSRFKCSDKKWYARYHSSTKKFKDIYYTKLQKRMKKIASINSKLLIVGNYE